jgi:RNA polymerase sigma factor (sigma-70 family)
MADLPLWPERVQCLSRELRATRDSCRRKALQGELWLLLHMALGRYLSAQGAHRGRLPREDLEDLAAQKALELLASAERGSWEVAVRTPGEIASYVSTVARNGLIDHARRHLGGAMAQAEEAELETALENESLQPVEAPEVAVERREFANALTECAAELSGRSRTIWFFRVFYDMSSKEIAGHPEVAIKPGHVDVVLQRCREAIRDCMKRKGHGTGQMPPGTFLELWKRFRSEIGLHSEAPEEALDVR